MQDLESRLVRLERQSRLWRAACVFVLIAGSSVLLMGQKSPGKTGAFRELKLLDKHGTPRAELSLDGDEQPRLLFFDRSKNVRLSFSLAKGGDPTIVLYDPNNKARSMFVSKADGSQAWVAYDQRQQARATMAMRIDGTPMLFFNDARGKLLGVLPAKRLGP